jgi:5'-3' exonuclease
MGIKHFFSWFRQNNDLKPSISNTPPSNIDHVLIDMNGIIHEAAQFVYKYGKYQSKISLPKYLKMKTPSNRDLCLKIKERVTEVISVLNPRKSVFLAIDGVAPKSKQNQQRQRRFRAALERNESGFDSNCITAGTNFMKELSSNLSDLSWVCGNLKKEISTDSVPGEGEHKLINWINDSANPSDNYCVVGLDADLILLCMMSNKENVYIMREGDMNVDYIDIRIVRKTLPIPADDLVVLSCFIGNDFLPPIPSFEIKESSPEIGALDYFIEYYARNPHMSLVNRKNGFLKMTNILRLMEDFSSREQTIMDSRKNDATRFENSLWGGNIEAYRKLYHEVKLINVNKKTIISDYLKTVQWVSFYYSKHLTAMPSWNWYYPYNYMLHAGDFKDNTPLNILKFKFLKSNPSHPHEQLLRVIPPKSKYLIPPYLHSEFDTLTSLFNLFKIDKSGKREDWEALTIVDFVNPENICYEE